MPVPRFNGATEKRDPLRGFNFRVFLGDREVAACNKVSGLTASVEVVKFRAGNSQSTADELLPGRVTFEPITLESGITADTAFKDWANALVHHSGTPTPRAADPDFRRTVHIKVYDIDNQNPVKWFTVHRAWVSKFVALPELAGDANETMIERIEIQHEGFTEEAV
ncbi:MAG TPA: phage tail protein [Polyangiaceae bacterium]|nr:phage tail protein [Polyangiaceae bacterium]